MLSIMFYVKSVIRYSSDVGTKEERERERSYIFFTPTYENVLTRLLIRSWTGWEISLLVWLWTDLTVPTFNTSSLLLGLAHLVRQVAAVVVAIAKTTCPILWLDQKIKSLVIRGMFTDTTCDHTFPFTPDATSYSPEKNYSTNVCSLVNVVIDTANWCPRLWFSWSSIRKEDNVWTLYPDRQHVVHTYTVMWWYYSSIAEKCINQQY